MKMHPKPMVRHTWPVIECNASVEEITDQVLHPVHIVLAIDCKTQRLVMSKHEARVLAAKLLAIAE